MLKKSMQIELPHGLEARPVAELVQVAILIAIAVVVGLIFNKQIVSFVNGVFKDLFRAGF